MNARPSGLILFEDEHLLVINKPAGVNTHAPSPFAGEGIYDWLRNRESRWERLAIMHRLDKETSGVMVFAKSPEANRSLEEQFRTSSIRKKYKLLVNHPLATRQFTVVSALVRTGERYRSRPLHAGGERAETRFQLMGENKGRTILIAEPITGKTHQIRVHIAEKGFPIVGDVLYGGVPANRLCLHAEELQLQHPIDSKSMTFRAEADFDADARQALRGAFINQDDTDAYRIIHGSSDGWPGWYVDRLGPFLLAQSEQPPTPAHLKMLDALAETLRIRGVYHKILRRQVQKSGTTNVSPTWLKGERAPERFQIRENGINYEMSFEEGYSTGLFLDQRDNRRRLLVNYVASGFPLLHSTATMQAEVLNTFAYTCGFSVCAARAGARTTSIDLSKNYLDWGKRNFTLNQIDPAGHDFIFGDVFDWSRRFEKGANV